MIYKKPLTCGLFRAAKPLAKTFSWILLLAVFSFSAAGQTSADNPKKSGAHAGFFADGGERLLHPSDPDFYTIILDRTGVAAAGLGAASTDGVFVLAWLGNCEQPRRCRPEFGRISDCRGLCQRRSRPNGRYWPDSRRHGNRRVPKSFWKD